MEVIMTAQELIDLLNDAPNYNVTINIWDRNGDYEAHEIHDIYVEDDKISLLYTNLIPRS